MHTAPRLAHPAAPIDSPLWYRVAPLLLRLRAQVRVRSRQEGAVQHYILADSATGRHHVVDEAGWAFVGRLTGHHTVGHIWAQLQSQASPTSALPPTQGEVLDWLAALESAGLLQGAQLPDLGAMLGQQDTRASQQRRSRLNPLSWRLHLGDPSRWLPLLDPLARAVFSPTGALLWLLVVLAGALLAAMQLQALQASLAQQLGSTRFVVLAAAVYPAIKLLHELAHALAVRRFGGVVRQCGVAFFFLVPAPFVDASAASGFAKRSQRITVSAAGIATELLLAALALAAWQQVQPGLLRDLFLAVATTSTLSTLLANANPLVRMDGYHVLCDALALPNLAGRSRRFWLDHLRRTALQLPVAVRPTPRVLQRVAYTVYAPAAWLFAVAMSVAAAVWLAGLAPTVALVMGVVALWGLGVQPAWRVLKWLVWAPELAGQRSRSVVVVGGAALVASVALLAVPVPHSTTVQAVAWMPEEALVRAQADGFAGPLQVAAGTRVEAGTPLLQLDNPELQLGLLRTRALRVAADMDEARAQHAADTARAGRARAEAQALAEREATLVQRVAQLALASGRAGQLSWVAPQQLPGRWVQRGDVLGHVLEPGLLDASQPTAPSNPNSQQTVFAQPPVAVLARAVVPEADAATLMQGVRSVSVVVAGQASRAYPALWDGRMPQATTRLPSAALGTAGGGAVPTDPSPADANEPHTAGLRSTEPVVVVDLQVPGLHSPLLGGRLYVRFDHGAHPLGVRVWQRTQQLLLRHWGDAPGPKQAARQETQTMQVSQMVQVKP
jgi:putative peptide zinc metalloprotease protein